MCFCDFDLSRKDSLVKFAQCCQYKDKQLGIVWDTVIILRDHRSDTAKEMGGMACSADPEIPQCSQGRLSSAD